MRDAGTVLFDDPQSGAAVLADAVVVGGTAVPARTIESVTDRVGRRTDRRTPLCGFLALAAGLLAAAAAVSAWRACEARGGGGPSERQRREAGRAGSAALAFGLMGAGAGGLWLACGRRREVYTVVLNRAFDDARPVHFGERREAAQRFIAAVADARGGTLPVVRPAARDGGWFWLYLLLFSGRG